jgi:acyl carrier protein
MGESLYTWFIRITAEKLHVSEDKKIDLETDLVSLCARKLDLVNFLIDVEAELGIKFSVTEAKSIHRGHASTVDKILNLINGKLKEKKL